jgi:PhzF family phenazine biosynthesis protein
LKLNVYKINAFTNKISGGNSACVIHLKTWLKDELLLTISKKNAVTETAFFIFKDDKIHLRWFTPDIEMDLCGHATLATAHCLNSILKYPRTLMKFETKSGEVSVDYKNGRYHMDFPSRIAVKSKLPKLISDSLNLQPLEVYKSRDYLLIYKTEEEIKKIKINTHYFNKINLDPGGVVVTSIGTSSDFVSRYFTPQSTILEDPATGSSHCSLIPFWSKKLNKKHLTSLQLSERVGEFECVNNSNRVTVIGSAITHSQKIIEINKTNYN